MGLRDRVIAKKARNPYSTCSVVLYAERLSEARRAEWLDCADDKSLPAGTLLREAAAEFGIEPDFSDSAIQRHRRGQCKCARRPSGAPDVAA